MKRASGLYEKLCNPSVIRVAHELSKLGKGHYREVKMVDEDVDYYCSVIADQLRQGIYKTSKYKQVSKYDGRKMRVIHKLPYYPDRIVQTAIVLICRDIWEPHFIRDTFQSIPKRGTSDARKRVLKAMKKKPRFALKMDIKKFYPSVNNDILKGVLRKKIKDERMLNLLDELVDSIKGLPIGNYTSQYFGNLYLTPFDWWMKQEKRARHYFRYCDDMIVLSDNKSLLHRLKRECDEYLSKYDLEIKDDWQVYDVKKEGIDFCGYRFYHGYTLLRTSIKKKMKKRCGFVKKNWLTLSEVKIVNSIMSYWGWIKPVNAKNLWRSVVDAKIIRILRNTNPNVKADI